MALVLRDRVKETTTTTGTGTVTLAGAVAGFQSFSAIGNANTTYYAIVEQAGTAWEVGVGTYTSAGTTLSRDTVLASSNAGALVNFAAGTKDVFCTYAATQSVHEDAAGNVDGYAITGGSINNTPIGATTPNTVVATTLTLSNPLAIGSGGTGKGTGNAAVTELEGFTTTATSGGTTTLTNTSSYKQFFTGSANQTITLPATLTLAQGWSFHLVNMSTGTLTVQTSTAVSLGTIPPNVTAMPTALTTSGNTATDWEFGLTDFSTSTGTGAVVLNSSPSINFLSLGSGTASSPPLSLTAGTNLTAVAAGAVEYDGTVFYASPNTTSGRGYTPSTHIFRLTANVTAFGPAIGNFFGANSAINLVGGGVYEIEAHCYFTKTTAGTVTVTITSSLAPVSLSGAIVTGAVGGGTAVGAANQIALFNSTATGAAFGATGSLTTAVNHYMKISLLVEANASNSNLRINFTSSAGTVTPLRTSYYKVTRLPAGNVGSFAA